MRKKFEMEKQKRSFVLSQSLSQRRERISFKEYVQDKKEVELTVDWIFLPTRFKTYGLLLTDGNEEYRISYNARAEVMEKILAELGFAVGRDYEGYILLVKKKNGTVVIEEGEEKVKYVWVSGKGWRLEIEKDDIPF